MWDDSIRGGGGEKGEDKKLKYFTWNGCSSWKCAFCFDFSNPGLRCPHSVHSRYPDTPQ